ncbi:hypothetical protein HY312_01015 [Candidatus Saccharibacteria bacterium]|nr:hypothetical protein [Candidatus Saccharibacteria bacterium]
MSSNASLENIADGPIASIIWASAQFAYDKNVKIEFFFRLESGLLVYPTITSVQHEDGSGQSFIIEGQIRGKQFKGYYHARNRSGFLNRNP